LIEKGKICGTSEKLREWRRFSENSGELQRVSAC